MNEKQDCYHKWKFYSNWCNCCSEFGHGVIVFQCQKCGVLYDKEFDYWSKDEIENLKSLGVVFPQTTIEITGVNND